MAREVTQSRPEEREMIAGGIDYEQGIIKDI